MHILVQSQFRALDFYWCHLLAASKLKSLSCPLHPPQTGSCFCVSSQTVLHPKTRPLLSSQSRNRWSVLQSPQRLRSVLLCPSPYHCLTSGHHYLLPDLLPKPSTLPFFNPFSTLKRAIFIKRQVWSCRSTGSNSGSSPYLPPWFTSPMWSGPCQASLPVSLDLPRALDSRQPVLFSGPLICHATVFYLPLYPSLFVHHLFIQLFPLGASFDLTFSRVCLGLVLLLYVPTIPYILLCIITL